jgi:hypothetical protein
VDVVCGHLRAAKFQANIATGRKRIGDVSATFQRAETLAIARL